MGWYLSARFLAPNKAHAVTEQVNRLCRELVTSADALVESFGIPQHLIHAPIAHDWEATAATDNLDVAIPRER